MIQAQCPHCKKIHKAPDDKKGVQAKCTCGQKFTIQEIPPPPKVHVPEAPEKENPREKECPFCSEHIKETAQKCRYCGEFLDQKKKPKQKAKPKEIKITNLPRKKLGCGSAIVIVVFAMFFCQKVNDIEKTPSKSDPIKSQSTQRPTLKTTMKPRAPAKKKVLIPINITLDKEQNKYVNFSRVVEITLDKKVTKEKLVRIAKQVKEMRSTAYKNIFIGFHLKDEEFSGQWASAHFSPNLDVKILGLTIEQGNKLIKNYRPKPGREVIGAYLSNVPVFSGINVLFRKNGKVYLDGFYGVHEVNYYKKEGVITYAKSSSRFKMNDFYSITPKGSLMSLGKKESIFFIAKRIY